MRLKPHDRILHTLRTNGGVSTRSQVWAAIGRRFPASRLNELLVTRLAGLVEEFEAPLKNYRNRTEKRWRLTELGWRHSGGIPAPGSSLTVNAEVLAGLLARLAGKGDKWALDVQAARRAWDARSRVEPLPKPDDVRGLLWRMLESPTKTSHPFARHYLKRMDSAKFRDYEQGQKNRAKEERARRKRKRARKPLDEEAIARINRARERMGEPLLNEASVQRVSEPLNSRPSAPIPVIPESAPEPVEQTEPTVYIYHDSLLDWYFYNGQRVHKSREEIEKVKNVRIVELASGYRRNGVMRTKEGIEWDSSVSPVPMSKRAPVPSQKASEPPKPIDRGVDPPPPVYGDRNFAPITPTYGGQPAGGLLAKIQAAGYQTNIRGEVLYDFRWIPAGEWVRKMGWKE